MAALLLPGAALAALLVLSLWALYHHLRKRHQQHHTLVQMFRWLAGIPWDGGPRTNATWTRHATRTLTVTGHARLFWHRPGYWRFSSRTGRVVVIALTGYGLLVARTATLIMIPVGLAALLIWHGYQIWNWLTARRFHQEWVLPMHLALAPHVGQPLSIPPRHWIEIDRDRSHATLALPQGFTATDLEKDKIVQAAAAKVGMHAPAPRWALAGAEPKLHLTHKPAPPPQISLKDIRVALAQSKADEIVLGTGRARETIKVSVHQDSPHLGVSIPSGGGKSVLARLIASQWLYKGGQAIILDTKQLSHMWARQLPNAAYCDTRPLIHDVLVWLGTELERRNAVAVAAADFEGEVHAKVGVPILIVAEELNLTMSRLRSYWSMVRGPNDPIKSPAITALEDLAFAGRQVLLHLLMIGQRLSANAMSSGDVRENMGVMIVAGDVKKKTWEMLAPEHTMPAPSKARGRIHVVTGDDVRECQVAKLSGTEAHELALAGSVIALPVTVPGSFEDKYGIEGSAGQDGNRATGAGVPVTPQGDMTLRSACRILEINQGTLKMWRHRYRADFPLPTGKDGNADLFSLAELTAFMEQRMVKA